MVHSAEWLSCDACGTSIPANAPLGQCPACLLRAGISSGSGMTPGRAWPADPQWIDAWFPDLDLGELLGWGGMGAVYRARQRELGREIALKLVPMDPADELVPPERLTREAQALARLSHRRIVAIHEVRRLPDHLCLVMEYVSGGNLRQRLVHEALGESEIVELVLQVCDGLAHAHAQGVVHRDIKPENVLLTADGQVKLADFGLAKLSPCESLAQPALTRTGQAFGSAHYVAPEQIASTAQVDARADLYAVGVMLYEMLTGTLPAIDYVAPSSLRPMDPRWDKVVRRLLRRDPQARYARAEDLADDLLAIRQTPPLRRRPWLAAGLVTLLVLGGIGLAGRQEGLLAWVTPATGSSLADLHGELSQAYVDLKNATATYSFERADADLSIRGIVDGISHAGGWSVFRQEHRPQAAVVQTVAPLQARQLMFEIENDGGGYPGYKPQRFRLYSTTHPAPTIADPPEIWTPLAGITVKTSHPDSDAQLEADGRTVRVTGSNKVPDDYFVMARGDFKGLTGFKIELLPGPNGVVGFGGPTGNDVHVTEFEVLASPPPPRPPSPRPVELVAAVASTRPIPTHGPAELIDGNLRGASFWWIGREQQHRDQVAIVRAAHPVTASPLLVELMHNGADEWQKLQRFRLSVTDDSDPTRSTPGVAWQTMVPESITADPPGPKFQWDDEGIITVSEALAPAQCSFFVRARHGLGTVTGFRLEALVGDQGSVGLPGGTGDVQLSEWRIFIPEDSR